MLWKKMALLPLLGLVLVMLSLGKTGESEDEAPLIAAQLLALDDEEFRPNCKGQFGYCGYVLNKTYEILIEHTFNEAMRFSEGLAGVNIKGKYGFIDKSGKIVIEPVYDKVGHFSFGLAEVRKNNLSGIIDKNGKVVVRLQFDKAIPFSATTILYQPATDDNSVTQNRTRYSRHKYRSTYLGEYVHGMKYGLYHIQKGILTEPEFSFVERNVKREGPVWVKRVRPNNVEHGLLKRDGSWVTKPIYSDVGSLDKNMFKVSLNGKWGIIDTDGNQIVPLEYDGVEWIRSGIVAVSIKNKTVLINVSGDILFGGKKFEKMDFLRSQKSVLGFDGDTWWILEENGNKTKYNSEGRVITECPSGLSLRSYSEGLRVFSPNNKPVSEMIFDQVKGPYVVSRNYFNGKKIDIPSCSSLWTVSVDGKWGFITEGHKLIMASKSDGKIFEEIQKFVDGYAIVKTDGKFGVINSRGEFTIEPKYSRLHQYVSYSKTQSKKVPIYQASQGNSQVWISAMGKSANAPKKRKYVKRKSILVCPTGEKRFNRFGKWGIKDANGKIVIRPIYKAISCFEHGYAYVPVIKKGKWCPITPMGEIMEEGQCIIKYFDVPMCRKPVKEHDDLFTDSVRWHRQILAYAAGTRLSEPKTRDQMAAD